jgi:hypothetical protein
MRIQTDICGLTNLSRWAPKLGSLTLGYFRLLISDFRGRNSQLFGIRNSAFEIRLTLTPYHIQQTPHPA